MKFCTIHLLFFRSTLPVNRDRDALEEAESSAVENGVEEQKKPKKKVRFLVGITSKNRCNIAGQNIVPDALICLLDSFSSNLGKVAT